MLRSRPSPGRPAMAVVFFIVSGLVSMPFYLSENSKKEVFFHVDRFFICMPVCATIIGFFVFLSLLGSFRFEVKGNDLTVKPFLGKALTKHLSDIDYIHWGSPIKVRTISTKVMGPIAFRNDFFTVGFKDGYTMEVSVKDYGNFDELRAWFLTYGQKAGIIKIAPLSERKNRGRKRNK